MTKANFKPNFKFSVLFSFFLLTTVILSAKGILNNQKNDSSFIIGVAGSQPFVVNPKQQSGISLEIWQAMASLNDIKYKIVPFENVPDLMDSLKVGKVDLAIGPITINSERAQYAKFTQPYFETGLSIMSISTPPTFWERAKPFFSMHFLMGVLAFLLILGIVGTLLWLTEREENPIQFPKEPAKGIANGMWCAIVTMSTTGYGDKAPVSFWGRIITGAWMVICIALATTMIASISSTLTISVIQVNSITKANQLNNKDVGVVLGSPSEGLAKQYGAKIVAINTLQQGYQLLKQHKIDAVVYDRPQLLYFIKKHHDKNISISQKSYMRQGYGFALPLKSNTLHKIDIDLLKLQESGRVERIVKQWLGDDQ